MALVFPPSFVVTWIVFSKLNFHYKNLFHKIHQSTFLELWDCSVPQNTTNTPPTDETEVWDICSVNPFSLSQPTQIYFHLLKENVTLQAHVHMAHDDVTSAYDFSWLICCLWIYHFKIFFFFFPKIDTGFRLWVGPNCTHHFRLQTDVNMGKYRPSLLQRLENQCTMWLSPSWWKH